MVEWFDACFRGGWKDSSHTFCTLPVISLGFLVENTKDSITLLQTKQVDEIYFSDSITIPKTWVIKMKAIK